MPSLSREDIEAKLRAAEEEPIPRAVEVGQQRRISQKLVATALIHSRGSLIRAAEELGVHREAVRKYILKYPKLQELQDSIHESLVDAAEQALAECVEDKQPWAIQFTLQTVGKNRGYVKRIETTGADGGPIKTTIGPDLSSMSDEQLKLYAERLGKASFVVSDMSTQTPTDQFIIDVSATEQ